MIHNVITEITRKNDDVIWPFISVTFGWRCDYDLLLNIDTKGVVMERTVRVRAPNFRAACKVISREFPTTCYWIDLPK